MKILFVQNIEGIAGSEKYFLQLIPELLKKDIKCEFCAIIKEECTPSAFKFIQLLEKYNIKTHVKIVKRYYSPSILLFIHKIYTTNSFDFLNSHLIYADLWCALVKKVFNKKIKIISTKHGYHENTYVKYCLNPENLPKNLYYYLFKFSEASVTKSYACSFGLRSFYIKAGLCNKNKIDVIQHGFDYPQSSSHKSSQYPTLIICGRLIERKGHELVLRHLKKVIDEFPNMKLNILGNGPLEESLKTICQQLNITSHIEFLGFKKNVSDYLRDAHLMLMPAYSEGLPLVIFEAFNENTPVIAFDTIGCNELVEDGVTGILATPFEGLDLINKTIRLLKNKNKLNDLGNNAYNKLKADFSLKRMVDETITFYESL